MFDSDIKVADLIEEIKNEADIAIPIPDASYVGWLNALEQLIYSEIIKEQAKVLAVPEAHTVELSTIDVPEGQDGIRFEDIYAVYSGGVQLKASTLASGVIFPKTYYKSENNLGLSEDVSGEIKVIYTVRPSIKTVDSIEDDVVMLPPEFIELAKAKLRGEAYKLANEDVLAAKWLNDYNVLLETFKVWIQSKSPSFGI